MHIQAGKLTEFQKSPTDYLFTAVENEIRDRAERRKGHEVVFSQLAIFEALVREHGDEPERIKAAITRFVGYVVWHAGQKGEGQLEVSLFAHPVALSPDMIDYDSALHGAGRCFVPESEMVGATGLEPVTSWV